MPPSPIPVHLTMLSNMAGGDFERSIARQAEQGIRVLDLKSGLWDHSIEELPVPLAEKAGSLITDLDMRVECLSSSIGWSTLQEGREAYLARHESAFAQLLRIIPILRPRTVRLLAPPRPPGLTTGQTFEAYPWMGEVFSGWIARIRASGSLAVIENEAHNCLLAEPADFHAFARTIGGDMRASFILDAQNLWQCGGTAPSADAVRALGPLLGGLHLKGGRAGADGCLEEAGALADATWPVTEVVQAALDLNALHSICLNPSHGQRKQGYDDWEIALRDLAFLRNHFPSLQ